jgi:hypothetical protein
LKEDQPPNKVASRESESERDQSHGVSKSGGKRRECEAREEGQPVPCRQAIKVIIRKMASIGWTRRGREGRELTEGRAEEEECK